MTNLLIIFLMFNLVDIIAGSYLLPSKNQLFNLSNNIVVNSNISTPRISPQQYIQFNLAVGGWSTYGIFVQYVDLCLLSQNSWNFFVCSKYVGILCGQQFLDTDSLLNNEKYYQIFTLEGGNQYQLTFDWISQISYLLASTGISIKWNNAVIDYFFNDQCTLQTSTYYLVSENGTNTLVFQGIGLIDSFGIMIRNINLRQLIYANTNNTGNITNTSPPSYTNTSNSSNNTSNYSRNQQFYNLNYSSIDGLKALLNQSFYQQILDFLTFYSQRQFIQLINNFHSLKQNTKFIVGFMLQFNHFLLYSYHLLNYTVTSDIIFTYILLMDDSKGRILDLYVYPFLKTNSHQILKDYQLQNILPVNNNNYHSKFNFRQNGFLLDVIDTLLMTVPVTLIIFLLGFILFKLLFKFRISILFRQYSIIGVLFYTMLDGKLEILTFEFLCNALLLTTLSFGHKMKTIVIVFTYFICFVFALGSMMVYRWLYRRVLKYVYDNCKHPYSSTLYMTLSYGIYNIILGALHRLLLYFPIHQIYALIIFEIVYLTYLIRLLFRSFYQNNLLALTLCLMNASRIAFLTTLLAYQKGIGSYKDINLSQTYIFYIFVGLWGFSLILCFFEKIRLIIKLVVYFCRFQKLNKVGTSKKVVKTQTKLCKQGSQNNMVRKQAVKIFILSKDKNNKTHIQCYYQDKIYSKRLQFRLKEIKSSYKPKEDHFRYLIKRKK